MELMASTAPRSAPARTVAYAEPVMASAGANQAGWAPVALKSVLKASTETTVCHPATVRKTLCAAPYPAVSVAMASRENIAISVSWTEV